MKQKIITGVLVFSIFLLPALTHADQGIEARLSAVSAAYNKAITDISPAIRYVGPTTATKVSSSTAVTVKWQGINLGTSAINVLLVPKSGATTSAVVLASNLPNVGQASVTIPNTTAGVYHLVLQASANTAISAKSKDNITIVAPQVARVLTISNQPTSTPIGGTVSFGWTATGTIPNVKVSLYKDGNLIKTFSGTQPGSGTFSFEVSKTIVAGDNYFLYVQSTNTPLVSAKSNTFSITPTAVIPDPQKSISSIVLASSTIAKGLSQHVTFNVSGAIRSVKISLVRLATNSRPITVDSVFPTGTATTTRPFAFDFTIPSTAATGTDYAFTFQEVGRVSSAMATSSVFSITAPEIPVVADVCPNIYALQTSIPTGMQKDSQGNCVPIVVTNPVASSTITITRPAENFSVARDKTIYTAWTTKNIPKATPLSFSLVKASDNVILTNLVAGNVKTPTSALSIKIPNTTATGTYKILISATISQTNVVSAYSPVFTVK